MHDDIALTTGRAARVLAERIVPAVHRRSVPFRVERAELPGEPIAPAAGIALDYRPDAVGAWWGPAWGTTWFRLTAEIPEAWAGLRVEAVIDLGFDPAMPGFQAEGLVYRPDGDPVKAVNPRNAWAPVAEAAVGGDRVELYVEAASNPMLLDIEHEPFLPTEEGDARTSSPEPLYRTKRLDLAVFEPEVFGLALDVEVLLELQAELRDGPRRMRILQALDDALDVLDLQDVAGTAEAARAVLAPALASPADASAHRISAIGHAHIDSAWLWPTRETVRKVARTAASMTQLMEEDDEFLYGMSSAQQYAWVKEHRPEVYERIRAAVAAGRFLPIGGMWVESDTVMPTGESIVRQLSTGQRFFEQEFGLRSHGVWLPDSFGYSPALPQLMRRAGFHWFFTQKISWNQVNRFPHHTFDWEGIDGSRVLTHFPPMDTYNAQLSGSEVARAPRTFQENRLATGSIAPVGWGDGGGGTTREMAGRAARMRDLEGSPRVAWEHPDDFFARAEAELPDPPVWVGELYLELHRATLTSQHRTKQGNRRSEHLLIEAEAWCTTAAVRTGAVYPYDELDALWKSVLLLQFHDILPGTAIAWVHREAVAEHERIGREATALIDGALAALAGEGASEVVVNPATSCRSGVPALGAALRPSAPEPPVDLQRVDDGSFVLDNGILRVVIDARGLVVSAIDRVTGREAIAPGRAANLLQLHQDFPNMWDAWDVDRYYRNRVTDLTDVERMTADVDEDGVARVRLTRRFSQSVLEEDLSLAPGSRTLHLTFATEWHEAEKLLKLAFPLDVRAAESAAETQFGFQRRVTHTNTSWEAAKFETSMHRFVLVDEPGFAVAVVNDSTYGFDLTRVAEGDGSGVVTTVRLSLLRAPRFPDPRTDQGRQTHRVGLVIGTDVREATDEGVALNAPLRRVRGDHGFAPLVTVSRDALVSVVKPADDRGGDLIVRLYEPAGRRAVAQLTFDAPVVDVTAVDLLEGPLPDATADRLVDGGLEVRLTPFEVRTLRVRLAGAAE